MRVILLAAAATISVATIATVALVVAFRDPCDNEAFEEFRSPNGRWKVVVFERSCGATTGFSTQASLLPVDAPRPKGAGNVLAIDDDHGNVSVGNNGKIEVHVRFRGDSTLTLAYPTSARAFTQVAAMHGVVVEHERLPDKR
jgi:hypothetical protein